MNSSLKYLCMKKIQSVYHTNLHNLLPYNLYISYVDNLIESNIDYWKNKMKMVNLEINIEDMDVNYDMYLDTPTYYIFVKKNLRIYNMVAMETKNLKKNMNYFTSLMMKVDYMISIIILL